MAAVVMAFCTLAVSSCAKPVEDKDVLEVSVKTPSVASGKGQMFVNVRCNTSWTLILMDAEDDSDIDWASLNIDSGKGNMSNVILSYQVNDSEDSRRLKIVLDNGSRWTSCMVEQAGSGQQPDPEPDPIPQPNPDIAKTGWLELPAMDDPALGYYSHSFQMGGKTYRNYSFGYSNKDYLAVWVAYPLSKLYMNGSVGDFEWYDNPLVDNDYEPNFRWSFGYKKDEYPKTYERGHQIAKADRKCSYDACQQTYYYTNATLQMADFNGHVWATLEANMRSSASTADTLYVVTGCTLSSSPKYIEDPSGHMVPVPSGYFKAAVRYHAASTISQWLGAAFYLDHDASKYPSEQITASESMSIDELEVKLGIDFFVNLPAKLGADKAAAIETQNPDMYSSVWGIR